MVDVIADKNYFYDAEGNVTTDESKGERWLAREGANVLEEHREPLKSFQDMAGDGTGKVAQQGETEAAEGDEPAVTEKAAKPAANKSKKPTENKGAK